MCSGLLELCGREELLELGLGLEALGLRRRWLELLCQLCSGLDALGLRTGRRSVLLIDSTDQQVSWRHLLRDGIETLATNMQVCCKSAAAPP